MMDCLKCFIIGSWVEIFPSDAGNFPNGRSRIISRLISLLISHSTLTEYSGFCCIPCIVRRNNRKTDVITQQLYSAADRAVKEERHKFHRTITVSPDTRVNHRPCTPSCFQREKFDAGEPRGKQIV